MVESTRLTERKTKKKNEQSAKGNDFRLLMDTSDSSSDTPKHKPRSKNKSLKMPEGVSLPFMGGAGLFSGSSEKKSSGEVLREMLDNERPRKCYI